MLFPVALFNFGLKELPMQILTEENYSNTKIYNIKIFISTYIHISLKVYRNEQE